MSSNTETLKCLIVEDDKFKLDSVRTFLHETWPGKWSIRESRALASAMCALSEEAFDVVIVDMSIPSHEPQAGAGSPIPFPNGGLDVLFEVSDLSSKTLSVVLTQYPDIPIEGLPVPVDLAAAEIEEKFGVTVAGCVRYSESDDAAWKAQLANILEPL